MCVIVLEWERRGYLTAGRFPGASLSAWKWEITAALLGKKGSGRTQREQEGRGERRQEEPGRRRGLERRGGGENK